MGRSAYADTFTDVHIDSGAGTVTLYATSTEAASTIEATARAAHPGLNWALVTVATSAYSRHALDAAADALMSDPANAAIVSAAPASDGSGIDVVVDSSIAVLPLKARARAESAANGIPLHVTVGGTIEPPLWRWNDAKPLIGGDVALMAGWAGSRVQCTTGLAVEDSSGNDFVTTAAHCAPANRAVYGEGDAVGDFGFSFGNRLGTTFQVSPYWDVELISTGGKNGSGSNSDEADTPTGTWYRVTSDAYSYTGDQVCQDGSDSYYDGYGVPCGISVTNDDIRYRLSYNNTTYTVRGVEGVKSVHAVEHGDSGGLVFTVSSSTTRQARGSVSAQSGSGKGSTTMYWTEAPDILSFFPVHLSPHT